MTIKPSVLILAVSLLGSPLVWGQYKIARPLRVGDSVPDISLGRVINSPVQQAKVSDFRGRLLILDFWATWCTVCIQQFPHLTSLQEKFKGDITILPVGFDLTSPGSIEQFVNSRKGTKREMKLPTAIQSAGDSILLKLFPVQSIPHEIWINGQGIVVAITDHTALTEENIKTILAGKPVNLGIIRSQRSLTASSPFLIPRDSINGFSCYGSLNTGYVDSISQLRSPFGQQAYPSVIRLFDVNEPVLELYRLAYRHEDWNKRVIVEGDHPFPYKEFPAKDADNREIDSFRVKNLFGYELVLPGKSSLPEAYNRMIQDLDRFFRVRSKIESRKMPCYALIKTGLGQRFMADAPSGNSDYSEDGLDVVFRNSSIISLLAHLNFLIPQYNVLNETGYYGKIGLEMHLPSHFDIGDIRTELKKFGLDLVKVDRMIPVIVLTSPKSL